ncbi:hypothetical protein [Thermodesulforhabdus norvegica]|uniref:Transposase and inactivated derivatives, IS1 family n=1 Tax=Thermodesulforhabdus norvegica TaxID=39841 RepID=A0A1I4UQT2_9BACT|nr:hypothetical protein [Thermodesulforhabdus norvegica]SFM91359.1 Transposase and inactivated derivatives, IS1 family [Thermodesulforhabdus norvegica]
MPALWQQRVHKEREGKGEAESPLQAFWNGRSMWTCLGDGKFLFEACSKTERTFLRFYDKILEAEFNYTDDFKLCDRLPFNGHVKGIMGKAKSKRNEGRYSILRDKLAGLRRKTRAYGKSVFILCGSIALLAVKNNRI